VRDLFAINGIFNSTNGTFLLQIVLWDHMQFPGLESLCLILGLKAMKPLKLQFSKRPALLVQLQLSSSVSPMFAGHRRTASFPVLDLWSGKPQRSREETRRCFRLPLGLLCCCILSTYRFCLI
jgi:hypothetical protein